MSLGVLWLGAMRAGTGEQAVDSGADRGFDQDLDIVTGPEVGERIPDFRAMDQNGDWQDFDSIKGPKGAAIVFHRSADW